MQAILCEKFDSPDQLRVCEIPEPDLQDSEVRIRIQATGLGYVDALTVAGLYQIKPALPFIPGNEIAGVIEQTGEAVKHLRTGQRVLASPAQGGLAEVICLNENRCIPIPDALSAEAAAGFQINYCTAWHGLTRCGALKEKETILILGASGGVGMAAIDVAKALGATVIAAASTEEKREACLHAGADAILDYSRKNWREELKDILDGNTLDLVYDPVGGEFSEPALRSLSPDGRFLVVGFSSGEIPAMPLNLVLLKRCSITGVNWGGFIAANPGESKAVMNTLLEWIAAGKLNPRPGESFPLKDAGRAMKKMLERKAIGKIVITMQDNP